MCGGMEYRFTNPETGEVITRKVYFPIPQAQIPVWTDEGIIMMQWGRRKGEDQAFDVPQTGWARIESVEQGKWKWLNPREVKIPALRFMEKDAAKTSHWFDLKADEYLLGLEVERPEKSFVYVVTKPAESWFAPVHERQPVVIAEQAC